MSTHVEHHYVPKFLLREWESGADGKLSTFRWAHGGLTETRRKAKSVAKERHLYAVFKSQAEPDQAIEREFMAKHVDDPAALVHQQMLTGGLGSLSEAQRYTWTRFLVSLALRTPEAVAHLRARGIAALNAQLDADPEGMLAERGPEPEPTLRKYVEKHAPDLVHDFGTRALPHIIQTTILNKVFFEAEWMTRRLGRNTPRFLIGDRPLTLEGAIADYFLLYLPLAPDLAFYAFNVAGTGQKLKTGSDDFFVQTMNKSMVAQASIYVYGADGKHQPLLERRLAKSPARAGLGFGPRPPE